MKEIRIMIDIDGTLISNSNGLGQEKLHINTYNLMVSLKQMKNTFIGVWSGGGKEYAEQIVKKYGLTEYVDGCFGKHEYDSTIDGKVDIAFDDQHEFSMATNNIIVRNK